MRLDPGATIGIVGAGQLARMLALAALELGFRVHIFAPPDADNVAFAAAHATQEAPYDDGAAMRAFCANVDVLTYEFENIPITVFDGVGVPVRPSPIALAAAQDRLVEKALLQSCGLRVAKHQRVNSAADLDAVRQTIVNGILKTRRLGYDGKGQVRITEATSSADAFAAIAGAPAILEETVAFCAETSVVLVRDASGRTLAYDTATNCHDSGILRRTSFPSPLAPDVARQAQFLAASVAHALSYVGVLAVEFFVTDHKDMPLIANEIAPRVHNTGHWTMDGAVASQFENHIRAVAGWPLGAVHRTADVTMVNLLGEDVLSLTEHLEDGRARPHIYDKRVPKAGRKMGHINFLLRTVDFDAEGC